MEMTSLCFVHERSRRVELKTSKKATPDVVRIKQPETSLETGVLLLLLILLIILFPKEHHSFSSSSFLSSVSSKLIYFVIFGSASV